ncbi:MAG: hypothetical protein ACJ79K_08895 [Gemmatimonadaceae bacterium]
MRPTTPIVESGAARPSGSEQLMVRMLASDDDLRACVDLQRATWGASYDELVPATILKVAQKIGGVAAGAFDENGQMLGFVFGMAGVRNGEIIHWSDMLAVREDARDRGVGQRLKEFQRAAARTSGATTMYWTYDPLVARNAHMNFNRLGVRVDEYVEDMYGASESDLHRGLGTDRFVVAWPLDRAPGGGRRTVSPSSADMVPVLNPDGQVPTSSELGAALDGDVIRVEIPLDIVRVRDRHPDEAVRWRASTRVSIQAALGSGFGVARFASDPGRDRGWYLMTRAAGTGGPATR